MTFLICFIVFLMLLLMGPHAAAFALMSVFLFILYAAITLH
jgi:hypothetical protein